MAFGIIRVRNLSAGDIRSTEIHNGREYESLGQELPRNINPEKCRDGWHNHWVAGDTEKSLGQAIKDRIEEAGAKIKTTSVMAIEYVVALTGGANERTDMWRNYSETGFLGDAMKWVAERHGGMQNVVSVSQHMDESNPHAHIIVVPLVEKAVKWKNQKGQGERTETRLCAKDFTGGPEKLRKLQDDYHKFVEPYGPKMGVTFYRGTKREAQLKQYTKATSHELGQLRAQLNATIDLAKAKVIKLEIEAKKTQFEKKQGEDGRIIELHKQQNGKDDKWKQKKDFPLGF